MPSPARRSNYETRVVPGSRPLALRPLPLTASRLRALRRVAEVRGRVADAWRSRTKRLWRTVTAGWWSRSALRDETGAATAEYAMVALGAVGLAGLLIAILRSDEVRSMLSDLISRALTAA